MLCFDISFLYATLDFVLATGMLLEQKERERDYFYFFLFQGTLKWLINTRNRTDVHHMNTSFYEE